MTARSLWRVARPALALALLGHALARYDGPAALARLQDARPAWVLGALVFVYLGVVISAAKWQAVLAAYRQGESLLRLARLYLEAGFFNLFFPGLVAGDLSRIARTSVGSLATAEAAAAVALERATGLLVTASFVAAAAAVLDGGRLLGVGGLVALLGGVAAAMGVRILVLRSSLDRLAATSCRFIPGRIAVVVRVVRALRPVLADTPLLLRLTGLGLAFTLASASAVYCVACAVDFPVPFAVVMVYAPLIALLTALPLSVAGLGVRENAAVVVYSALGFRVEDALTLGIAHSALVLLVNLSGGLSLLAPRAVRTGDSPA